MWAASLKPVRGWFITYPAARGQRLHRGRRGGRSSDASNVVAAARRPASDSGIGTSLYDEAWASGTRRDNEIARAISWEPRGRICRIDDALSGQAPQQASSRLSRFHAALRNSQPSTQPGARLKFPDLPERRRNDGRLMGGLNESGCGRVDGIGELVDLLEALQHAVAKHRQPCSPVQIGAPFAVHIEGCEHNHVGKRRCRGVCSDQLARQPRFGFGARWPEFAGHRAAERNASAIA